MRTRTALIALLATAAAAAGCSSSDTTTTDTTKAPGSTAGSTGSTAGSTPGTTSGTAAPGTTAPAAGFLEIKAVESPLGTILVDDTGRTLYAFTKDVVGEATACTDGCAVGWPPAKAIEVLAGDGVQASVLAVTTDDQQVTAGGHRLYYFAGDEAAGETNGQGTGDAWFVVGPDGTPITAKP